MIIIESDTVAGAIDIIKRFNRNLKYEMGALTKSPHGMWTIKIIVLGKS
jgi:hypothetical protein